MYKEGGANDGFMSSEITVQDVQGQKTVISRGDQHIFVGKHELEHLTQRLKARQTELYVEQQRVDRVRVLLADDSPVLRAGMRAALEETGKFSIVAEAGTVTQAFEFIEQTAPDMVIASLCLPDASGVVIGQKYAKQNLQPSIILLGFADVDVCLVQAWDAGAHGFINKQMDVRQIVQILEMVSSGQHIWSTIQLQRIQQWKKKIGTLLIGAKNDK